MKKATRALKVLWWLVLLGYVAIAGAIGLFIYMMQDFELRY